MAGSKHVSFNAVDGTDAMVTGVCAGSLPKELGGLLYLQDLRLNLNKLAGSVVCAPVG